MSVIAAAATHFAVNANSTVLPNTAFNLTVAAVDPFGNTATGYGGTVDFSSTDAHALLPANATLSSGLGSFSAILETGGEQTITATDSFNFGVTGSAAIKAVSSSGIAPFVQSINRTAPAGPVTNTTTVVYTVTFSQAVTGVNLTDFALALTGTATGALTQVTPVSGAVYTVTVSSITGTGTLGLNLVDNGSIYNLAGNPLVQQNAPAAFQGKQFFILNKTFPGSVVLADVNGDGIPDIIVDHITQDTVSVLLGNGNGTFQAQQTFATGFDPNSVAVGDLTGDGNLDLVVAYGTTVGRVGVLLGNGNGTFQAQKTFVSGPYPTEVALGDVNGDGKPDIVVGNGNSSTVSVLLGNGNGTFQARNTFATKFRPYAVALGDVNGDGEADIVVANLGSNTVSVLLGNGNGTFQAQNTFATGSRPYAVALGDVNGDGKPDIVVPNYLSNTVSVLLGNGNGTFQAQQTFAAGAGPDSVVVGDINGDGKPDIVVGSNYFAQVSVLLGNGNGTFQALQTFAASYATDSVAVGDLNGDGKSDLVLASPNGISVLLSAANGDFNGQTYTVVSPAVATQFVVTATPATVAAGSNVTLTVTAQDPVGQLAYAYAGTVQFTSSDGNTLLPPSATLTAGVGVFSVIPITAGTQTITATDTANSSLTGTSGSVTVSPAAANHFSISAPSSVSAGTAFNFTVTAEDPFDNPANYAASLLFTSSDSSALLPANATLSGGRGTFSATLNTLGSDTISVYDAAAITVSGKSTPITASAPATHFVISAPTSTTAGSVFIYSVTAEDSLGNTAIGYGGMVHISSSDAQANLSADATLSAGIGFFGAALRTAGTQTLTATDATNGSLTGTSAAITVGAVAANHFAVSAPAVAVTGKAVSFTVTAEDPFNNIATGYTGTVQFTSTDAAATLPGNKTLTNGVGAFSATLQLPRQPDVSPPPT